MKFNCGPTPEERRATKLAAELAEIKRLSDWHLFFPLWPRRVARQCFAFEWIERRGSFHQRFHDYRPDWWSWEYRAHV